MYQFGDLPIWKFENRKMLTRNIEPLPLRRGLGGCPLHYAMIYTSEDARTSRGDVLNIMPGFLQAKSLAPAPKLLQSKKHP